MGSSPEFVCSYYSTRHVLLLELEGEERTWDDLDSSHLGS